MDTSSLIVVVRTIGERTFPHCIDKLQRFGVNYRIVNEKPFVRAVEKTFDIGVEESGKEYLLALDADVVLNDDAIPKILSFAKDYMIDPSMFRIDYRVRDKFRGKVFAGCHLYRNSWSQKFRDAFKKIKYDPLDRRPESGNIQKIMNANNLFSKDCKSFGIGKHDFGQFYSHIYTKYYNRAVRDHKAYEDIHDCILCKKEESPKDHDFQVALAGMEVGRNGKNMRLHSDLYLDVSPVLRSLGIKEKRTIPWEKEPL